MPITPTYPGVYIEEVPSTVRTITGVSTSITAFIGRALKGPTDDGPKDKAKTIHSFADYQRIFGGLWKKSNMSYAVYHYFLNGGMDAVIVRVHNGALKATYEKKNETTLKLEASNPGEWADKFEIIIDHDVDKEKEDVDSSIFNLKVTDEKTGTSEAFLNVSTNSDSPKYIERVLEAESKLVRIQGVVPPGKPPECKFDYVSDSASDGNPLNDSNIIGDPDAKTGIYALDNVDLFNLLCIPPYKDDETTPGAVYTEALTYCKKGRAMLIVDSPEEWKSKDAPLKKDDGGIESTKFGLGRDPNAAIFFPRIKAADPELENRLREFVPCGAVAGVIARTDSQRGIWKSPAGIEATLVGASDLTVRLTDKENGDLNPLGINCLRIFPVVGRVVWGARTMKGADRLASEWKYLSVRRMALYIEESLYRGTQWVVFEPNDEPLWSQIRLNVGAFMHSLFRQGAFQGSTPKEAYFVRCDKETTTQDDINRGIVNIIVGFAPLKPAEFVILKITQITGQEAV